MPKELIDDETKTINCIGTPHCVILFNDSVHSFDEVTNQIVKALNCTHGAAGALAMEAHTTGQSVVFSGGLEQCELIDMILSGPPASLRTSIQQV